MSDEMTMVAMLAIAAGTALFVAWPLMFGTARPDDFLEAEPPEPGPRRHTTPGGPAVESVGRFGNEVDKPSRAPHEQGIQNKARADLDVELEIEAFRRHSQQGKKQDDAGRQ